MDNRKATRTTSELRKINYFKEESKKSLIAPFQSLAKFTAIAGIIALVFEVRYFSEFSYLVYLSRVTSILLAFTLLIFSYTNKGKKHPVFLIHTLLITIISSFGVIIYLYPKTLTFNSHIIGLIIFTAALFLSWDVKNQIIAALYYIAVFAASIILNEQSMSMLLSGIESVVLVVIISIMAIIASYINYKLREDAVLSSYETNVSEKRFRNLFENAAEGIFQINSDGLIFTINPSFVRMLGYSSEEDLKKVNALESIFKTQSDFDLLKKLLEKQGKVRNYRVQLKKKDGHEITVRMNVRLNDEETNQKNIYEGSLQDISQQVIAESERQKAIEALKSEKNKADIAAKKAQQESKFKTKFLASMSHEVRTPMNSVMGFLTLVENDLFESKEELKQFSKDAKLAAESLLDIINNILDISKIEAGKMELDEEEFEITSEINKAVSILKQTAKNKGLELDLNIDENIPRIMFGDPTRYRQIAVNLIANAVKYTEVGSVKVNLSLINISNNQIEIGTEIIDTGRGIAPEQIPQLFEAYSQIKNKNSAKEGTGLGLVISKEFVKLMGGEIKVESRVGFGSKFSYTVKFKESQKAISSLPKQDQSVEELQFKMKDFELSESSKNEINENTNRKKRLLLVEDNPISQNLELKILKEVGYDVEAVGTGQDAIEAVYTDKFDLVLMDVEMQGMDGLTATKRIRESGRRCAKVPIIAVTAHSSMKDREVCLAAGMNDYIAKPINIHFLKITIDQWLTSERQ
ncbi:MAG: response regulator [Melioribacteraceae bacterium]